METNRVEAFSDGVLAVAITLLVLDLRVDAASRESLAHQLWHEWPSFAAYAVSFLVIGVIWVNHHAVFRLAVRTDRVLMFYNLMLLLSVTAIPFTTATLADYLQRNNTDTRIAVLLYGAAMEGMAISFALILARITRHRLTARPVSRRQANRAISRFALGSLVYPVITGIGLCSPTAMLALYAALTVFYILEQTPILTEEVADHV